MDSFIPLLLVVLISLAYCCVGQRKDSEEDGKLSFLAVGDAGGFNYAPYYTKNLENVAKQMGKTAKKTHAKFVIGLGDNFYWKGVKDVHDFRFNATFENIFRAPSLHRTKWYMLAGNHDYLGNVSAQIAYTKVSRRWHFPDFYYTTVHRIGGTCKTVQIVTIDTTLLCYKGGGIYPGKREQYRWLNEILRNSEADYLVVAGHHPVYSIGMHGSNVCLNDKLRPLLEKYDVTAYLSGHDHNMQHFKPLYSNVHYLVSGSASNHNQLQYNKHKVPLNSLRFFNGKTGGFTLLQATPRHLTVSFIGSHGKILHTEKIPPRKTRPCSKKNTKAPFIIEDFEDSVLGAFFGLQEDNELRQHQRERHTGMNG
ncbi:tartrate-resistant acid phosphatase type 5-like [Actinia tenebrosa]|uniref:Tartrate-resistant acid phosphatase type 5 n=1 Tax=Actinia tenebrosa TaxID=6105 RepID=A0A6P8HZF2_ACTTE|nr:tartrate-resistant acid phosphatase type 5-like [Actinia tenebrosa]